MYFLSQNCITRLRDDILSHYTVDVSNNYVSLLRNIQTCISFMYLFQVVAKLGNLHNNTPFVLVDPVVLHTYIPCYYNSIEKEYNVLLTWMKNRSPYSFALLRWEKSFEKKEVGTHWYIEMRTTVFAWEPSFKIITVRLKFQEKYQFNGGKGQRIYIVPKKNLKLLLNVAAKQFWKK